MGQSNRPEREGENISTPDNVVSFVSDKTTNKGQLMESMYSIGDLIELGSWFRPLQTFIGDRRVIKSDRFEMKETI